MENNELMLYLELAFVNYNEFAIKHCQPSFFTQEVNSKVIVYTVPDSKHLSMPEDLSKLIHYIVLHEDDNIHALDVLDDLKILAHKIQRQGGVKASHKPLHSINLAVDSILCTNLNASKTTRYFRVTDTGPKEVTLVEIANHQGKPIFSAIRGRPFKVSIDHNAIILNGQMLVRYVHRPSF